MLTTADGRHISYDGRDFERMQILAEKDSFGVHSLVDSPDDADVILFVNSAEPNLADVARHPFVRRYRDRVFLHHTGDKIFPVLPGVYPSIDRRWRHFSWAKSGCYP
ncbi:MAG: hypothetical protein KJN78_10835, partial [Gammaproteobacteria bacterium]|nr:hypothetical protein [Gammaproteobacteria bacterium]